MTNISKFTHNEIIENYNSVKDRILKAAESVDRVPDLITLIVVTKTLDAMAGSIFIFFKVTGTKIPNNPATIMVNIIEIEIIKES